jgi:hypothetical protein
VSSTSPRVWRPSTLTVTWSTRWHCSLPRTLAPPRPRAATRGMNLRRGDNSARPSMTSCRAQGEICRPSALRSRWWLSPVSEWNALHMTHRCHRIRHPKPIPRLQYLQARLPLPPWRCAG